MTLTSSKGSVSTPASVSTQDSKFSDKTKKKRKKKHHQSKRDFKELKDSSTPSSGVNVAEVGRGGKRTKKKKNLGRVTCFNCNKKKHFQTSVRSCQKTSIGFSNFHVDDWYWKVGSGTRPLNPLLSPVQEHG